MKTRFKNPFNKSVGTWSLLALLLCLPFLSQGSNNWGAEEKPITGIVTSAEDGMPMIGVSVSVKGTSTGTVTDIDGSYNIDVDEGAVLVFNYTGFKEQELVIGAASNYDITLQVDSELLDEVVVVGYGNA